MSQAAAGWFRTAWPQGQLMALLRYACTQLEGIGLRRHAGPSALETEAAGDARILRALFVFACADALLTLRLEWWLDPGTAGLGRSEGSVLLAHGEVPLARESLWLLENSRVATQPHALGGVLERHHASVFEGDGLALLEARLMRFARVADAALLP